MDPFKFLCILPILHDNPEYKDMDPAFIEDVFKMSSCTNGYYSSSHKWTHLIGKGYKEIEQEFFSLKNTLSLNEISLLWGVTKPSKKLTKISKIELFSILS
ncbi:hypothetical protein EBU94_04490 [bacterium]|nr:hypothetical protein [bacterium]